MGSRRNQNPRGGHQDGSAARVSRVVVTLQRGRGIRDRLSADVVKLDGELFVFWGDLDHVRSINLSGSEAARAVLAAKVEALRQRDAITSILDDVAGSTNSDRDARITEVA